MEAYSTFNRFIIVSKHPTFIKRQHAFILLRCVSRPSINLFSRCRTHHHRPPQRPKAIFVYHTAVARHGQLCAHPPRCTPPSVRLAVVKKVGLSHSRAALRHAPLSFSHPLPPPRRCPHWCSHCRPSPQLRACSWLGIWPLGTQLALLRLLSAPCAFVASLLRLTLLNEDE